MTCFSKSILLLWRMLDARRSLCGVTLASTLLILVAEAKAQGLRLRGVEENIQLCNRTERDSLDLRISSCTALIESGAETPRALAIAYNNRGNAYNVKGDYDRAIADYNESIKADPNYAKPLNNRGSAYQKLGQYKRAIEDFDRSIRLDPKSAPVFANRAELYGKLGDYQRALRDYDRIHSPSAQFGGCMEWTMLDPRHHRRAALGTR